MVQNSAYIACFIPVANHILMEGSDVKAKSTLGGNGCFYAIKITIFNKIVVINYRTRLTQQHNSKHLV